MKTGQRRAFKITIFLADGHPDGLRVVEKSNWTGCGVVFPRSLFSEVRSRREFNRAGVYLLVGPAVKSDLPQIYIGEGDPVRPRIEQHFAKRDFWTTAIFFTSKDENLNKAHVQLLEARLSQLAKEAKRCELENGNEPQPPSLSEADAAEVEGFLDEMLLCFPIIGISAFEKPNSSPVKFTQLQIQAKGIKAFGYESAQGFIVIKGSEAVTSETPSIHRYLADSRKALQDNGILKLDGAVLRFAQDYVFNSPSTAAGVVLGKSSNGRTEWVTEQGRSLKSIQEASSSSSSN